MFTSVPHLVRTRPDRQRREERSCGSGASLRTSHWPRMPSSRVEAAPCSVADARPHITPQGVCTQQAPVARAVRARRLSVSLVWVLVRKHEDCGPRVGSLRRQRSAELVNAVWGYQNQGAHVLRVIALPAQKNSATLCRRPISPLEDSREESLVAPRHRALSRCAFVHARPWSSALDPRRVRGRSSRCDFDDFAGRGLILPLRRHWHRLHGSAWPRPAS